MEKQYSASEIVMLEIEINDLREKVIKLETERSHLLSQIENLKSQLK